MITPFQSQHFTLHTLTEGVYAAIATEGGAGFSNAGLMDLGEQTLVFDAFENPQAAEERLVAETDPGKRQTLQVSIARQRHTLQALLTLEPTLPNQTFEGKIVFHGKHRSAKLIATGKAHTESDCILSLPQDRLTFIGDISFFQSQPFMPSYGSPPEWIALLDHMATWDLETFVPGHGPLRSKTNLDLEARYNRSLEDMARRVVQAGGAVEDALSQILPSPYDKWQARGAMFEANVRPSSARHSAKYRKQTNKIT
jgi:cyclase